MAIQIRSTHGRRIHPERSSSRNKRIARRIERTVKRAILRHLKKWGFQQSPEELIKMTKTALEKRGASAVVTVDYFYRTVKIDG